ncbi:MAG TPA: response regulator, partial [Gemmataceae bacterium]|nr:response regulator [Gemmataceae bacterium]
PRVFDVFAQENRSPERESGGLGLGLALVKGLTELHGGTVTVSSAGPGHGAQFTVRLPLESEPAAVANGASSARPAGQQRRVLIIEDNRDAADMLRLVLESQGHEVRSAYNGPDGVRLANEWQPEVVLCDIGLPGLDGYAVAATLRRQPATAQARLVAITGYGGEENRRRALQAGFDQHLTKPVSPEQLQETLVA